MAITTTSGGVTSVVDYAGSAQQAAAGGGIPHWKGTFELGYGVGRFDGRVQVTGFTDLLYNPTLVGPDNPAYNPTASNSISQNKFPGAVYVNLNGSYMLVPRWGVQIYGIMNNVFNKRPPQYAFNAFSFQQANYYDVIGRSFQIGARFRFK